MAKSTDKPRAPKLILLNGFSGTGKSTLAKMYVDDHPLALRVEGDDLIVNMGQYKKHYEEARRCKLKLSEIIVKTHLESGHDVVLPFLLTDADHAERYRRIAQETGATYHEVYLVLSKEEAIRRLYERGRWGEEGLPGLTEEDLPQISELFDDMDRASRGREDHTEIVPDYGRAEVTYEKLLACVEQDT